MNPEVEIIRVFPAARYSRVYSHCAHLKIKGKLVTKTITGIFWNDESAYIAAHKQFVGYPGIQEHLAVWLAARKQFAAGGRR